MIYFLNLEMNSAIQATALIAAVGILIMSLEDITMFKLFRKEGILSWDVLKLQGSWSVIGCSGKIANLFLEYGYFRGVIMARLLAAITLLMFHGYPLVFAISAFIIFTSLAALTLRSIYGLDGAHQMHLVIWGAFFLSNLAPEQSLGRAFGVWFIAMQAGFAYLVSGIAKLISPMWRSGDALIGVFGTEIYGNRYAYALFARCHGIARIASWTVILFECSFWTIFIVNIRVGWWILAGGLGFHIVVAILMGLNGFLFAFAATYPCIVYCAQHTSVWFS